MDNDLQRQVNSYAENQYKNSIDQYDYSYWQEKKFRVNSELKKTLPDAQRLAIYLYNKMYKLSPKEMNQWIDESFDFQHDWNGELHKKYLRKARRILRIVDFQTAMKLINAIFKRER